MHLRSDQSLRFQLFGSKVCIYYFFFFTPRSAIYLPRNIWTLSFKHAQSLPLLFSPVQWAAIVPHFSFRSLPHGIPLKRLVSMPHFYDHVKWVRGYFSETPNPLVDLFLPLEAKSSQRLPRCFSNLSIFHVNQGGIFAVTPTCQAYFPPWKFSCLKFFQ